MGVYLVVERCGEAVVGRTNFLLFFPPASFFPSPDCVYVFQPEGRWGVKRLVWLSHTVLLGWAHP